MSVKERARPQPPSWSSEKSGVTGIVYWRWTPFSSLALEVDWYLSPTRLAWNPLSPLG